MSPLPSLRYLSSAEVIEAMPSVADRLSLAERTLRGLAGDAELPPKIGVHPRPPESFGHAMPAFLPGSRTDGSDDLLGMKWVSGNPANGAAGLAAIHGLLVLNDPVTAVPRAILDAGPITAERTAAVSGVAIRAFAPALDRPARVGLIGAGVQGRSHLAVLGHVLPGLSLSVFDRATGRAEALAEAASATSGIASVSLAPTARGAVDGADVVVTAASFVPPPERQVMTRDWLSPHALVVPVDYATYCAAEVARDAGLFLVDHRDQWLRNRDAGLLAGFPDPTAMLGEALAAGTPRPAGRVVAMHLGTGLADVVFGAAILEAAEARGLGTLLPR